MCIRDSQYSSEMDSRYISNIHDEVTFKPPLSSPRISIGGSDLSSDRRTAILQEYFKSTSALTRSIILEKNSVEKEHSQHWTVLSDSRRDQIVNEHFVPSDIRELYEGGLIEGPAHNGWRPPRSVSRQSGPSIHSSQFNDDEQTDGTIPSITLSQPSSGDTNSIYSRSRSLDGHTRHTTNSTTFSRNKLRSYSIRMKKGEKAIRNGTSQQEGAVSTDEFVPLFDRDVYDLDDDIDLPDESLMTDHIDGTDEDDASFARLKPLRYSFGRKMRNKVSPSPDHQFSDTGSSDSYIISNQNTSMQDLTQTGIQSFQCDHTDGSSHDFTSDREGYSQMMNDPRSLTTSPINMSDDAMSIVSRQSTRTPDSTTSTQLTRSKLKRPESPFKHPLSRSTRAGSSYMTVTSDFAGRRQISKPRKTSENTSVISPSTSPPPQTECTTLTTTQSPVKNYLHTTLKQNKSVSIIKTDSVTDTDVTTSSSEQVSPFCSPPPSPAGNFAIVRKINKRESGYMSSTCDQDEYRDASDEEEENPKPKIEQKRKQRRKSRVLHVERTMPNSR